MNKRNEQLYFLTSSLYSKVINALRSKSEVKSILIIKWDEIGDMVYALHVFSHLKIRFPEASQTLWCKPFVKPLVQNHPAISHIVHSAPQTAYDLVVELRGDWNTLKYCISHPPKMRVDRGSIRLKNKLSGGQKHEVVTNFQIIEPLLSAGTSILSPELHIGNEEKKPVEDYLNKNQIRKYAVIHCGARRKLRQWSISNFVWLARHLKEAYGLGIVFVGTSEDEPDIEAIVSQLPIKSFVSTRDFNLLQFAALTSNATVFVGNESGPIHIAAVVNTPLLGLYGPGVKDVFYPIGQKSKIIHHVLDCNPCDQIHCVRPENPCINLITTAEVSEKLQELLGNEVLN